KDQYIGVPDLLLGGRAESADPYGGKSLKDSLAIFKRHFIRRALEDHDWNQTETAKVLDIQRTYLSRLIKELSINDYKE
ncbi:MAG TPA: helix-turn-helix domain-containing protein, partial [Spirochaetales bacterium]|nr:helix-turn-helix domain-containing protein [Spirochaetales bacterium]